MMHRNTLLISLIFLFIGFSAAYFIFDRPDVSDSSATQSNHLASGLSADDSVSNPFMATDKNSQDENRLQNLENEISYIKQQLSHIEQELQAKSKDANAASANSHLTHTENRPFSALQLRLYKLDNLIKGGIDPVIAEDIVRRKNSVELKRLELQDRAKRNNYLNSQQYHDELKIIDQQDISLREVLGDDQYDEYLFKSKQNNRIKIASVMLGSSAEQAGIQTGDVVLSYDNSRMFGWQELKNATTEGQLGEYVSISIYRNGEIYSFSVPRGPLGVQLGATRLQP